jgi:hypothetical protein
MRTLNVAATALLARIKAGERVPWVQLVEILTASPLRFHTGGGTIQWGGNDWFGDSVAVEPVADSAGEFPPIALTLPAVTEDQISLVLTEPVEGVRLRIYDALIDPQTGVVADAVLAWTGTLNVPGLEDGPAAIVSVTAEHRGIRALRPKPSRYTDDEQRRLYSGDSSLDFDPASDAGGIVWPAAAYFKQ